MIIIFNGDIFASSIKHQATLGDQLKGVSRNES